MAKAELLLYGTTFTLHRVSPLHASVPTDFLSKAALDRHARLFAEALQGNILQGVHVGLGEDYKGLPKAGALQKCGWSFVSKEMNLGQSAEAAEGDNTSIDGMGLVEGIHVELEYERATYTALLVRSPSMRSNPTDGEWHLPLLLTRLPAAVRGVLFDYIADSFDARIEPLCLDDDAIDKALGGFIEEASRTEYGLQDVIRNVQMSIGFGHEARAGLRSIDITIRKDDLKNFLARGRSLPQTEGWNKRGPFMRAVDQYLANHLALDRFHRAVHLSRVVCGTFALGREGRVKMFAPSLAADEDLTPQEAGFRKGLSRLIDILLRASIGEQT